MGIRADGHCLGDGKPGAEGLRQSAKFLPYHLSVKCLFVFEANQIAHRFPSF
jgi:hypothetical protein